MSKKDCCPNCGAPMNGDVCEYCGTRRTSGKTAAHPSQPGAKTGRPVQKTGAGALVVLVIIVGVLIAVSNIVNNIASRVADEDDTWDTDRPVTEGVVETEPPLESVFAVDTIPREETTEADTTEEILTGTRENPVAWGSSEVFFDEFYDYEVEIAVTEVLRGSEALQLVKDMNSFNTDPPAGKEYMLAKVRVKGISSKNGEKISLLPSFYFECASQSGTGYAYKIVYGLNPTISDVYPGGETEGYLCYIVDASDAPLIGFRGSGIGGTLWFATQ